jgi:hypothetical protein
MPSWLPPGNATDLNTIASGPEAWDFYMTALFREAISQIRTELAHGDGPQFTDAVHEGAGLAWTSAPIPWNGFPKTLSSEFPSDEQALKAAEEVRHDPAVGAYRPQDEYLEWHPTIDAKGKITAVDFTCEGPEYWQAIAEGYPTDLEHLPAGGPPAHGDMDIVLALYQQYISPEVKKAELLNGGKYDPHNIWNTERGAMHLTHPANNLLAEVFLAAEATILREKAGVPVIETQPLIHCAKYGEATRASDPTIGAAVNGLARNGDLISLLNPVGLYIDSIDTTGWTKPDGTPVGDYWKVLRGTDAAILRARYEVPAAEGFTVSDILIGGEPIRFAGQIAKAITMRLTGVYTEEGKYKDTPVHCKGEEVKANGPLVAMSHLRQGPVR